MQQKFTYNDLVRFLYRETDASETLAIGEALHEDRELAVAYEELAIGYQQLPKVQFRPAKRTIQRILTYSDQETFV